MSDSSPHIEERKLELEERWRRRAYVWSITSGLLTAAVTISVALIGRTGDGSTHREAPQIAAGPVQSCDDSLRRLQTLAGLPGQNRDDLSRAILTHVGQCDAVLTAVLHEVSK